MSPGAPSRPLSIAFLTSARAWRGSGVSLSEIALGLADRGHVPSMLASERAVVSAFQNRGLSAAHVPAASTGLGEAAALRRELRKRAADVLVVDRPRDLRLAALATIGRETRLVYRYNLSRRAPSADLLTRIGHRLARLVVFLSESSARGAHAASASLAARPWRVIPNGVDAERLRPDAAAAVRFRGDHALGDGPLLVTVGSLTAEKRHALLLEMLAATGSSALTLVVCGDGPLRSRLEEAARARGLPARFVGVLDATDLPGAYSAATAVVHACAVETFGLSVLEAMACGAPVVAPGAGAVPEVLGDTGVLVAASDAEFPVAAASAVRALVAYPARRAALGSAARERAVERFPLSRMRAEYADALEGVACA